MRTRALGALRVGAVPRFGQISVPSHAVPLCVAEDGEEQLLLGDKVEPESRLKPLWG